MLEDDFTYVLRKALLGHALTPVTVAPRAGLLEQDVQDFLNGSFVADTARKLAAALNLKGDAFASHHEYTPRQVLLPGIHRLKLPFSGDHVNAWIIGNAYSFVLFDAGNDASDLIRSIGSFYDHMPDLACVTHTHNDHIGGVDILVRSGVPVHGPGMPECLTINPGAVIPCGGLSIRACDLSGHAMPSLGYHVDGLPVPVLVTGDALFAGSIGGCPTPSRYQLALARLRDVLSPLPDETIVLPGHGPATTLGEERVANPFL
jgi:hydroxyacylglutathione hydrolase